MSRCFFFNRICRWIVNRLLGLGLVSGAVFLVLFFAFPFDRDSLQPLPQSPVVLDQQGRPLLWRVGSDDQWRLDLPLEEISPWLVQATVAVEDERFYSHSGVDILAVARACYQNLRAGRRVSGASTLTMQVCKMLALQPRTWKAKCEESFRALQLERILDKDEILAAYLNRAPYGGNIRGVQAASLRYFGVPARNLSLGEAALLAGLPKAPETYRPDRYLDRALDRRQTVLRRMQEVGVISRQQAEQAAAEPVILQNRSLAPCPSHGAWWALNRRPLGARTTLDLDLQRQVERLVAEEAECLPEGGQLSLVVIEIETGQIKAMIGSSDPADPQGGQVNGALAWRSPGSVLKPFVYGAAFEARRLAGDSLVYDLPVQRAGWTPRNFDRTFSGALPVAEALQRSLNVPAILVAEGVGLSRCTGLMQAAGIRFPGDVDARGGLAVVVGAVEVRLVDVVNAYATLGRSGRQERARLFADEPRERVSVLSPNVCAALENILSSHARRPIGMESRSKGSLPWFMWKTGTSSGRRDAWAVGQNRNYAVGIWAGRFSGTGDEAFVGSQAAEPLLARVFDLPSIRRLTPPLPARPWPVTNPLPPPAETGEGKLAILSPEDGSVFKALAGQAVLAVQANRKDKLQWFQNGRRIKARDERLACEPGRHELRCVSPDGAFASVRFRVE